MPDEKSIIVFKIIKEFNIGLATLNEFLKSKKLISEDLTQNSKIPESLYEVIAKEFGKDKKSTITSTKIADIHSKTHPSGSAATVQSKTEKYVSASGSDITMRADSQKESNIKHKEDIPSLTVSPVASSRDETNILEEKTEPMPTESLEDTGHDTDVVKEIKGPIILGKINLEDKTKSKKKKTVPEETAQSTTEVQQTTQKEETEEVSKKTDTGEQITEVVSAEKAEREYIVDVVQDETRVESSEIPSEEPRSDVEKVSIEIEKIRGPIVKGKIELIEEKKPKKTSLEEKKTVVRSETEPASKEHIQQKEAEQTKQTFEKQRTKEKQPVFQTREYHKDDKSDQKTRWKDKDKKPIASSEESKIGKHKRKRIERHQQDKRMQHGAQERVTPEISDEEIQRQIKETLARLTATRKSKASKYRRQKRQMVQQQQLEELERIEKEKNILRVTEFITVNDLANLMNVPVNQVIATCLNLGLFVSINQRLDAEVITIVADEYGYDVEFIKDEMEMESDVQEDDPSQLVPRHPVVTVMGHVDHGKTSLLDYIRKTNVIAGEAGGITQHIGAYEVQLPDGRKITFLDTPGHEAFTAMRARGAKLTDIAIIVIAADDRVMPQTVEAINHARAAGVPMVFAINKIDKPNANPEKIKEELAQMNILVEDWGGKYQCQEISAKMGTNVDLLLEKVLLEAELLDLKANPNRPAVGTVIESSLEKGRGYVAKILVQNGTLRVGDVVVAGCHFGKVKALFNERNQRVQEAGPSSPVLMVGLEGAPNAGDKFQVYSSEKEAKQVCTRRQQLIREQGLRTQKHITLDEIGRRIAIGDFKELNLIVKGDVDGSVEALSDALLKLSTEKVQVNVIHKSVGQITESDVLLASASDAIIIGFQVRPSPNARKLAEQEQIDIRTYSVIYDAIEEIKAAIEGMLAPEFEERVTCNVEVREVFKISKVGTVAGCYVLDGKITRNTKIRVIRDGIVIYEGALSSLKRYKDDVKEVSAGYECGLTIENFNDIKVGDIIEGYEVVEKKPKL